MNYIGSDQHVRQLTWNGSAWVNIDLTANYGNGVLAASNSALTSFLASDFSQVLYYIAANQHVYQFYINASFPYTVSNGDVTNATGAPLAANGSALTSFTTSGPGNAVYFIGTDQHVHELYWTGSAWTSGDLTGATGGPLANVGALTIAPTSGSGLAVYYVSTDQSVYQLYWTGSAWTNGNVTFAAGGPSAANGSGLTSITMSATYFPWVGLVYYVGINQHVYELYWNGVAWTNGDLTNTLASSSSSLTSFETH